MKQILFTIMTAFLCVGCSKEEARTEQTIMVNVSYKYQSGTDTKVASPTIVQLYSYEKTNGFDKTKSISSMANHQELTMPDGITHKAKYTSDSFSGVNIMENIPNGKYILVAFYKPDGYSWPMFYYYGYKTIDVNDGTNMNLHSMVFVIGEEQMGSFTSF